VQVGTGSEMVNDRWLEVSHSGIDLSELRRIDTSLSTKCLGKPITNKQASVFHQHQRGVV
jgi:hypothetical protein